MVKKLNFLLTLCTIIVNCNTVYSQTEFTTNKNDSIDCEKYFEYLRESSKKDELITQWAKMPVLKKCSYSVLRDICVLYPKDTINRIIATLVIDKKGNPVCININIENDSLKISVINLLYKLKFDPAIGLDGPVISHYPIIIDSKRCNYYLEIERKNKKQKSMKCSDKQIKK